MSINTDKITDTDASASTEAASSGNASPGTLDSSIPPANTKPPSSEKQLMSLFRGLQRSSEPLEEKPHVFWDTQPVPKMMDSFPDVPVGPIDSSKTIADVRPNPYALPEPFSWVTCDITNDKELEEIYSLLNLNYVEDDDNMFRFDYSKHFLRWALSVPGYNSDWHIGVRTDKGKLVAFITGVPATISVHGTDVKMAEINFLCVHKKLRSKRLAPVLIKEVTRRINLTGIWQAVYTAGIVLTKPLAECTYFHRSLNVKKLVEVRFTSLGPRTTMSMAQRIYKLPEEPQTTFLRPMELKDVPEVLSLLMTQFKEKTQLYPVFTEEDVAHVLLPRENVVASYVRELDGKVTDFLSFYMLPSSVIGNEKYKTLQAAYSFYHVATSVSTVQLAKDGLILAKNCGMDVFNALDLNSNSEFIRELKFGRGDGSLRYYLYNYLCPKVDRTQIGLVML